MSEQWLYNELDEESNDHSNNSWVSDNSLDPSNLNSTNKDSIWSMNHLDSEKIYNLNNRSRLSFNTDSVLPLNSDPFRVNSDPLPLNSDPLGLNSDPFGVNSHPLGLNSHPLPLNSDPLPLNSDPLPLNSDPVLSIRSDPVLLINSDVVLPINSDLVLPINSDPVWTYNELDNNSINWGNTEISNKVYCHTLDNVPTNNNIDANVNLYESIPNDSLSNTSMASSKINDEMPPIPSNYANIDYSTNDNLSNIGKSKIYNRRMKRESVPLRHHKNKGIKNLFCSESHRNSRVMKTSICGREYLSIPDVFSYLTFGGQLNINNRCDLGKYISNRYENEIDYDVNMNKSCVNKSCVNKSCVNKITIESAWNPILGCKEHIKIRQYQWSDYTFIARYCLEWYDSNIDNVVFN